MDPRGQSKSRSYNYIWQRCSIHHCCLMISRHRLPLLFLVLLLLLQLNQFFSSKLCVIDPGLILRLKLFLVEVHNFPIIALHIEHLLLLSLSNLCLAAGTGSSVAPLVLRVLLLFWKISWMRCRLVNTTWRLWSWYAFCFGILLLLKLKKHIGIRNLWLLVDDRGIRESLKTL